jgi:hypothetical protein
MRHSITFVIILGLTACVELCHYDKHGASTEEIHRDQSQCEEAARTVAENDKQAQQDVERTCMQALGYHPINYFIR